MPSSRKNLHRWPLPPPLGKSEIYSPLLTNQQLRKIEKSAATAAGLIVLAAHSAAIAWPVMIIVGILGNAQVLSGTTGYLETWACAVLVQLIGAWCRALFTRHQSPQSE